MRFWIGLVAAAVMLLPLAGVSGPPPAHARSPQVLHVNLGGRPHPCTPYAGCDLLELTRSARATAP